MQFDRGKAGSCMSSVRILVVEDYEPFQRFICSTLGKCPELQVICSASDGLEAVQKAEDLQPDLILLDIGLLGLNGIEAARRIRKVSPNSKILFLSQESSADVVQAALNLGALGYVVKARAESELLTAVEAVRKGMRFVSGALSADICDDSADNQVGKSFCHKQDLSSLSPGTREITRSHEVRFYSDDASLLLGFACLVEASLELGNPVVVVATESHAKSLLQRLLADGVDVAAAVEQGRYIPLDVAETLSQFMVNDLPDPDRFREVAGDLFAAADKTAKGKHPRVAACGECAPTLWAQGKPDAAIQLEHLWDEMAKTYEVDISCGYVLSRSQREHESAIYQSICAEHSAVFSE
jgi:DNA-binding NarL/FixJ family response regulator